MTQYRYVVHDLLTNTRLGEIPLGSVRVTRRLANAFETLTATLDLGARSNGVRVGGQYRDMLQTGRTKITPLRGGENGSPILGSHIVWGTDYDGRMMGIAAAGMFSYFTGEYAPDLISTKVYTAASDDQFDIVRDLIANGQTAQGNIGLLVTAGDSGVTRDRTYNGFEEQKIGKLVTDLAAVDGGFDMVCTTDGDPPVTTLNLHYPRAGRFSADNGIVFTLGQNLRTYRLAADPPTTVMRVIGMGEGDDMLRASQADTSLLSAGWPKLTQSRSHKTVELQGTLQDWAVADLTMANREASTWTLELVDPDDVSTPFGSWMLGDDVRVVIPPDIDSLYPEGLTVDLRILGQTVEIPDNGGPERITLEMGAVGGT